MGRRSTSSTKSGKFMNPTDQARKEARKRELKKNKKQRMMVRAAVLKMKDPKQIIRDMEKLDEMEFNPVQQPQLNEKVLKDKRKKLRETFERILRLYEKENPDIYKELRKLEVEYEQKRAQLSQYFDAVKNAQHVEVDSIPLPDMPHAPSNILIQDIPLPGAQPPSILKKTSAYGPPTRAVSIIPLLGHGVPRLPPGRKPPGPPPGPPPPQVLQMYGRKVGFALDLPSRRRDEDMLYSPELAQRGHDDDVSSTSEDDGYPEDMDQDKHDDSSDDSDTDRSDGESEGDEFVHRDDNERSSNEEKKSGLSVRFADMPGKSRKKKKNIKELTPLQAMMLRMAGQEIPEEGREVEEFSEDDDEATSSPTVCSPFSDTSTSHARTTSSWTTSCSTFTASWTAYWSSSWATSRSSSVPETTWNARTPRAFTPTFTSRTTTWPTPWPSPRSTSRSASWPSSSGTPTKATSPCTSRYPPTTPWHDAPTFGASTRTCPTWAFPTGSLAKPRSFKCSTQLDSAAQGG
ncbi:WW domain binding protein 11 [Phyllostomus discolor]|uniref:WW domain binding protein 11 n=1 Tax=Phyllostomus discolor TaxID=89673 RepID=A0A834B4W3_9CHIR|nr:WW domain binding protein 11 [Phyllostomus discolor]